MSTATRRRRIGRHRSTIGDLAAAVARDQPSADALIELTDYLAERRADLFATGRAHEDGRLPADATPQDLRNEIHRVVRDPGERAACLDNLDLLIATANRAPTDADRAADAEARDLLIAHGISPDRAAAVAADRDAILAGERDPLPARDADPGHVAIFRDGWLK